MEQSLILINFREDIQLNLRTVEDKLIYKNTFILLFNDVGYSLIT